MKEAYITHHITWEVHITEAPKKRSWFTKLSKMVAARVHIYRLTARITCREDDSLDSQMASLLQQVKHAASQKQNDISSHNGVELVKFIHEDNFDL